ncbi:hypothetical protein C8F04DRAFT_1266761 [Mycena alexandri]|uniref:Uncharacterized protein n=1 Tax=Mycena alexandri TaxID=1745969 RepID=A0AAD6SGN0_9AGAR|nr:hypothetical protein C8F04DRAFT_1266761 [Mycena alexandri]
MVKGEGNERPKGPITSHAKTNAALIPAQLKPVLPTSSASSSSPFSSTFATAVTALLVLCLACSRTISLSALPISASTSASRATMNTAEHLLLSPSTYTQVEPRADDEYSQHIHTSARGDSPYVSCAYTHSKHADAAKQVADAAAAANEHNGGRIEQGTRGGDAHLRNKRGRHALPARARGTSALLDGKEIVPSALPQSPSVRVYQHTRMLSGSSPRMRGRWQPTTESRTYADSFPRAGGLAIAPARALGPRSCIPELCPTALPALPPVRARILTHSPAQKRDETPPSHSDSGVSGGERENGHENASAGVQEEMRARLHPASPSSFLSSSPPSRAPPHTRAIESSTDGTTFRLPVLRADALVCAPSPRAALQAIHLRIVALSLVPTLTHPTPSLVVPRPRIRTHAAPARALSAPIAVCANSHSAGTQLRMRVESPRAAPQVLLAFGRCARTRTRTSTALRGIAPSLSSPHPHRTAPLVSSHPPYPSSSSHTPRLPALAPPHTFCPRLALGAACGMRAVCVDGVPRPAGQRELCGPSLRVASVHAAYR